MLDPIKVLEKYGKSQSFEDTASMLLCNRGDRGSEDGILISLKRHDLIISDIKLLMKIAWQHGNNACACNNTKGNCDYCADFGADSFERFISEFKDEFDLSPFK